MFDIIVITYNAKDKLRRCIQSVKRHTRDYLLTIVDNNSRDGTRKYLRSLAGVNIILNKRNLGFCGGANLALRKTSNDFIVLLDDDIEVTKSWLNKLYTQIEKRSNVGMVGCKFVFPGNRIFSAGHRLKPLQGIGRLEIDRGQRDYIKECDIITGACWLMKRELIERVGYFDQRFFPCQAEDIDYCIRVRLAGYKIIYNGQVKIIHHHLFRKGKGQQNIKNQQRLLRKWKHFFRKYPLKDTHLVEKHIALGVDYLRREKFRHAHIEFRKIEAMDKRFSEPFYAGLAMAGMGKYDEAIQKFKGALNLNPSNISVLNNLILCYKKIGLTKQARKESIKILPLLASQNKKFKGRI